MFDYTSVKHSFTTHRVPLSAMVGLAPINHKPQIGQLVVAEVLSLGQHIRIENRSGAVVNIFPGDQIVGAFGNRYATDQFEGYVPQQQVEECDMLSVGGVIGEVVSKHHVMNVPTRMRILGQVCDERGQPLSQQMFGLSPRSASSQRSAGHCSEVILVVGASMNSGKTTTVGMLARALTRAGLRVAAAKVTGTAAGKDGRFFASCGANPVLDFTDAGYPSTYMLNFEELVNIYDTLLSHLRATQPDYILVEIADGIFQRETRMLLESEAFRRRVDHVLFAANDSLSAECGVRYLHELELPLRFTSGALTQSQLSIREAEEVTDVPCLSSDRMMAGEVVELLDLARDQHIGRSMAQSQVA